MNRSITQEGVNLNEQESRVLALRIAMQHLVDSGWLDWESYPGLSAAGFRRLEDAIRTEVAEVLRAELRAAEQSCGIDSGELLRRIG